MLCGGRLCVENLQLGKTCRNLGKHFTLLWRFAFTQRREYVIPQREYDVRITQGVTDTRGVPIELVNEPSDFAVLSTFHATNSRKRVEEWLIDNDEESFTPAPEHGNLQTKLRH